MNEKRNELVSALYEISTLIFPRDPKNLLIELGREILKRMGFEQFRAEVPALKLKIRIPENGESTERLVFSGKAVKIWLGRDDEILRRYQKIFQPVFEKLDYTIGYIVLTMEREDLLKLSPDIIVFLDDNGRVVEMNETAKKIFGEVLGENFEELCSDDVCEADGRVYSLLSYRLLTGKVVVGRDITERIKLEKELEERERRFRTLAEVSPVGIIVHQGGKIVFANDEAERLTGYSREELIGKSVWDLIHPDYHEMAEQMQQRRLRGERPVYELRIVRKDGKERCVLVSGSAMLWKGRKSIIAIVLDITERKKLEEQVRESERLFRTIFNSSPIIQFITVDEKFTLVNRAFESVLGYDIEEIVGKSISEIVHRDDREGVREHAIKMLRGETDRPYRFRALSKGGDVRWLYGTVVPIEYKGKKAVLSFDVDITELEAERKKLEELTEMLELINRTLRHDVLNALTSSLGYLETAIETGQLEYAEKSLESVERAVDIVRNMRAFESAVKKGELKCISVDEIIEDVVRDFDVPVKVNGRCMALADEGLRSVVENIVQNAKIHSGTDRIDITVNEYDDYCEIRVADYGRGIPDEIKDRVFEEGFKYGETAQTGLGLFIVRKIIERYGGKIWVEDNKPKGSVFVIRLKKC
ncbi:PAS domain S-box protein [Archaeoglobus neptunius]|uniref:PAS domain S-box protein n=1 Tax=Archaeoglobus neptunius TaxID=2798580 RepID=UPI002EDA1445